MAESAIQEPMPPSRVLMVADVEQKQHAQMELYVALEPDVSFEDAQRPEFWQHCGQKMPRGAVITLQPHDYSWRAELLILSGYPNVRFEILKKWDFSQGANMAVPMNFDHDDFQIEHIPGKIRWRVVRKTDKEVLIQGLATKVEAARWLEEHRSAQAR